MITEKQALEQGIKIREDWRKSDIGDHILTTDGMVLEVQRITSYKNSRDRKSTTLLHTEIGVVPTTIRAIYAKRVPKNKQGDRQIRKSHLMMMFINDLIKYGKLTKLGSFTVESRIDSYKSVFAENNDNNALFRANRILKKDWVQKEMSKTIKEEFKDLEVNEKWFAKQYYDLATGSKTPAVVRKQMLEKMNEWMGFEKEIEKDPELESLMISMGDIKNLAPYRKIMAMIKGRKIEGKPIDAEFVEIIINSIPKEIGDKK